MQSRTGAATGAIDELVAGVDKGDQMAGFSEDKVAAGFTALPMATLARWRRPRYRLCGAAVPSACGDGPGCSTEAKFKQTFR